MFYLERSENKMSIQPYFPGFTGNTEPVRTPQRLPATPRQLAYALQIAARRGASLPAALHQDRAALSEWIDRHKRQKVSDVPATSPSSKQVAFAEKIARIKRRDIPRACFQDRTLMARWIDCNLPR
jgi:hypothetical protein